MNETSERICTDPALRLLPPSEVTGPRWVAHDVLERRSYRLAREGAAILVAGFRPGSADELASRLAALPTSTYGHEEWLRLVASMRGRGLLVEADRRTTDPRYRWMTAVRTTWGRNGWREAAEYHIATFDYPCVDYADGSGFEVDHERMRRYNAAEPDDNRVKLAHAEREGLPLPAVAEVGLKTTARELWSDTPVPPSPLDRNALETLLSLTFGQTGERRPQTVTVPLLLRTSPSGGARHPSEGYVLVRDVDEIAPGWHHVTMRPFSLRHFAGLPDESTLERLFADTLRRSPFPVRAIVVLTTLFERNMYRYREPRTFRTVHMDAGHLAGTVSLLARALGVASVVHWADNAAEIERALGLDGMHEGYMLAIGLGDGRVLTD